jgi:hypothetical protein
VKLLRKAPRQQLRFGGFARGMHSAEDHLIPPGHAKTLRNLRFEGALLKNRYGWKTLTNGLTSANTWTWSASTKDTGYFREFASCNSGKIAVFEKRVFYDPDYTTEDFDGGGNIAAASGQPLKGGFFFATHFYAYSAEKLYRISWGNITALTAAPTVAGTGYEVGNILRITTGGTLGTCRVATITGGGVTGPVGTVTLVDDGYNYTTGTGKVTAGGTGTGCTVAIGTVAAAATLTEKMDFANDIDISNTNVIKMFARFGELWAFAGPTSRAFYSDTGLIEPGGGTAVSNFVLPLTFDEWLRLDDARMMTSPAPVVEYCTPVGLNVVRFSSVTFSIAGFKIKNATAYLYVSGGITGFTNGMQIFIGSFDGKTKYQANTFTSGALNYAALSASVSAGATVLYLTDTDDARAFCDDGQVTLSDTDNSTGETVTIRSFVGAGSAIKVELETAIVGNYSSSKAAKLTSKIISKVVVGTNWDHTFGYDHAISMFREVWGAAPVATYQLCYDPDNDDDIDGHVRFTNTGAIQVSTAFRISYTPYGNPWKSGNAGVLDCGKSQGEIVDVVDSVYGLYIFKKNPGAIYLLSGFPGPGSTPGSQELKPIYKGGIVAEEGTVQGTRHGIFFSSVDVDKVRTWFMPYTDSEVREIPEMTPHFKPAFTGIGNSTYTMTFKSAIVNSDKYLLNALANTGTDFPEVCDSCYVCEAYNTGQGWGGRWVEWLENQNVEYTRANATHTLVAKPRTLGYYEFNGRTYRVYALRDATDAAEKVYQVARLGVQDGHESPIDDTKMLYAIAAVNTVVTFGDGFDMLVKTGKFAVPEMQYLNVLKLMFDIDCTAGSCVIDLFKDYTVAALLTKTASALSDTAGSERIMRDMDMNFNCQWFQVQLSFRDVDAAATEEHLTISDVRMEVAAKAPRGRLTQTNVIA